MRRDPLIIGAGPAGTAAAITLGRAGHRPTLIERASGPVDKVCGDFLSIDSIRCAQSLGVDPAGLGGAPIHLVRVINGNQSVEAALPFPALGLSRRRLDAALLRCAEAAGAVVRTGQTVRRLTREAQHWRVLTDEAEISADTVFLATGKHDVRDQPRPHVGHGAVGMKMYLALAPAPARMLDGATELTLFPGGYAGLQCVEDGKAVLCIAVNKPALQACGGTWHGLVATIGQHNRRFAAMMTDARPLLPRPLAVAGVPYGYQATACPDDGLFRLGDQAAVIPSLTGDGMAIALYSGQQAAEAWLNGAGAGCFQRNLLRTLTPQMRLAGLLHRAGLSKRTQTAAVGILRVFPGLLRHAARHTRLRSGASLADEPARLGAQQQQQPV